MHISATRRTTTCTYAMVTGTRARWCRTTTGSTMTGTVTILLPLAQFSSFLPCFRGGVLFLQLSKPTTEHTPYRVKFFGKRYIFFIVQRFCFPKYKQKYFYGIYFSDSETHKRNFVTFLQKTCNRYCFYAFYKQIISCLSNCMTMNLG